MNNLILRLRFRFEALSLRERALCLLLTWAVMYALFALIFSRPVNNRATEYLNKIKLAKSQLYGLQLQIDAIDKIAASPLYIEWKKQHTVYEQMQTQYKTLISNFSASNWHEILKTVISSHPNITLAHVENSPEKPFAPEGTPNTQGGRSIYQQHLTLIMYGDYLNTIKYLQHLEKVLPNVRWDTLKYEAITYPTAKITIGFSVFYGKQVKS